MIKKIFLGIICILVISCAYIYYSIHKTRKTIFNTLAYTLEIETGLDNYIAQNSNYLAQEVTNQTLGLPEKYTFYKSALDNINVFKPANSSRLYLNLRLNAEYINFLPFTTSKAKPFLQFQYTLGTSGKLNKYCYSNLNKVYLPPNCHPY